MKVMDLLIRKIRVPMMNCILQFIYIHRGMGVKNLVEFIKHIQIINKIKLFKLNQEKWISLIIKFKYIFM